MKNEIMVSIICNAYNHEKYIRDALDSFLMQKTDFAFEVLIHDDASTDKTADIIREYEAKYPDIIRPIYQTENQYSQGVYITMEYQQPRARGKYIAFCEGDDYWTDPRKLQKQVDAMEKHPHIDMCAHGAKRVRADNGKLIDYVMPSKKDTIFSTKDVILGKGGYIAHASLLYRKSLYDTVPEFVNVSGLDYFIHINGSLRGGLLYLSECMSAYRWMAEGSWNSSISEDTQWLFEHRKFVATTLDILDAETDFRYTKTIHRVQMTNLLYPYRATERLQELLKKENREIFSSLPFSGKAEVVLKVYFPFLRKLREGWDKKKAGTNE